MPAPFVFSNTRQVKTERHKTERKKERKKEREEEEIILKPKIISTAERER